VHERYRRQTTDDRQTDRQTDGRAIAYSEREREFTFAKMAVNGYVCFIYTIMPIYLRASLRARAIQFILSKHAIQRVLAVICNTP